MSFRPACDCTSLVKGGFAAVRGTTLHRGELHRLNRHLGAAAAATPNVAMPSKVRGRGGCAIDPVARVSAYRRSRDC